MTTISSSASASRWSRSRAAYARAASGSWIEQGPTSTTSRSSWPRRAAAISCRAVSTVARCPAVAASSVRSSAGVGIAS
jgi:hypothetical protein